MTRWWNKLSLFVFMTFLITSLWLLNLVGACTTGFRNLSTIEILDWVILRRTGCAVHSRVQGSILIRVGHTTYGISLTHITILRVGLSQGAGQKSSSPEPQPIKDTKTLLRNQTHQELLLKDLYHPVQRKEKTQINYRVLFGWVKHWNCWRQ